MSIHGNSNGYLIELTLRTRDFGKVDSFKCTDKNFPTIVNILRKKYNIRSRFENFDKDIAWVKTNSN